MDDTESSSSSSSEDQSSTECSTDSSDDDEKLETAQVCGTRLQLPQGLCERKDVLEEFFSAHTWNSLSEVHKQHLKSFLPTFPENDEKEKNITLYKLFNNEVFRFTSPLQQFHDHLKAGHYRPDIAKMRLLIKKAERKEAKFRHKLHRERLKVEINESKNKLVNLVRNLPPGVEPRMERLNPSAPSYTNPISFRTKRRYFQELTAVREKVEENGFSSDENYPEGPPTPLSRKQKRHLNSIKNSALNNSERINSTFTTKPNFIDLERLITPNCNPFFISEDSYRNLLLIHKKKRVEEVGEPEYSTSGITIADIINRTDLASFKKLNNPPSSNNSSNNNSLKHHLDFKPTPHKKKIKKEPVIPSIPPSPELINKSNPFFGHSSNSELDSDSDSFFDSLSNTVTVKSKTKTKKLHVRPLPHKQIKKEIKTEPIDSYVPSTNSLVESKACLNDTSPSVVKPFGKITPATLSDLDGIDMMNLPIDLDDSNIDILEFNNKPELMQETHANFLSLVRDIICSTNEHRMSMKVLEERLKLWQENPISPLNDWYSLSDNWVSLLPLAISFLSGNCSEQPDDFVPYIEYKTKIDMYQWIGAGRDSDSLLSPLCQYWLEHRNQMKPALTIKEKEDDSIEVSDRSQTPPPPRCPTAWTIRKANPEEIKTFQEQERRRYSNPHKSFTYRCYGYESVVGPVKGIYNNQNLGSTKARGHSVLTADRPNFVTILTLVRDATARLPNGEGTRADICELLKSSQYLSFNVSDNILQSVVSGALDRMHTQFDPCVKYEPKRKVWIYLHRNRSEEDFERIHQQYQGISRNLKKPSIKNKQTVAKPKSKSEKSTKNSSSTKIISTADNQTQNSTSTEKSIKTEQIVQLNITEQQEIRATNVGSPSTSKQSIKSAISTQSINQQARKSPVKSLQKQIPPLSLQDKQISESLLSTLQTSTSPAVLNKSSTPNKSLVKVISSNQGKSLIIPTSNTTQVLKQIEQKLAPNKQISQQQPVSQQLLQSIAQQKQMLLQKQNAISADQKIEQQQKSQQKVPVTLQQQILQTVGSPQMQNIKNVTLLRNPASLSGSQTHISATPVSLTLSQSSISHSQTKELTSVSPATSQPIVQEQVIQTGVQNKVTQQRLTPAQQQQILQTLRQKVLPLQQTVMSSQYRTVSKQKPGSVQMQKQIQPTSLLGQVKVCTADVISTSKPITSTQTPLVAKVLTNAAGQVISVESLLAHQKQHGSLPQGTTLRISGSKSGQQNVIIAATSSQNPVTQFTVATPNITTISNQPKLVISTTPITTTVTTSTVTVAKTTLKPTTKTQTTTKFMPKIAQQLVSAKFITQNVGGQKVVQPKVIVGQQNPLKIPISSKNIGISKSVGINVAASANTIRMVNAANLNLAQIGGKPVLITSKGNTFQNIQGQNIIIQTQANTSSQGLIIPNTEKTIANTNISQQSSTGNVNIGNQQSAQVILSPPLKVQQAPQVVLSSALKTATVGLTQQNQSSTPNQIMLGGQTIRLQTSGTPNTRVVLASQNQGQIITQQILLPVGFQGTPLNIKALQGVKVVPIAQTQQGRGVQGRQLFARVMNPANLVRMTQSTEAADVGNSSKSTAE